MHTQTIVTTAELTLVVVVIFYEQSRLRHDCVDVCTLVKFPPNDSHGITPHFVRITIRPLTIITFRADILYLLFLLLFLIFVRGSRTNAAVKKLSFFNRYADQSEAKYQNKNTHSSYTTCTPRPLCVREFDSCVVSLSVVVFFCCSSFCPQLFHV